MANSTEMVPVVKASLLQKFAERYEMDSSKVLSIVSATVFKQSANEAPLSMEEVAAALIVANQYELNPFTKEIYAFRSKGKLLIVVSIDGWCAIINRQPMLDGIEFEERFYEEVDRGTLEGNSGQFVKRNIYSITCKIHRKDRRLPTVVTEYHSENVRDTEPWKKSPIRMLRHRSLIQCARVAFSISGVVDEDEAETIQGFPNGPVIDATPEISAKQREAEGLMSQLGWNDGKKTQARSAHPNPEDLIKYLNGEIAKRNRVSTTPRQTIPAEAQPQTQPSTEDPQQEDSQGTMPPPPQTQQVNGQYSF